MKTSIEFNPLLYEVQQDPYPYYAQLREEAPVYFIESIGAWGLFRYDDVASTFKRPELFSARDFIASAFGEFDPVPEVPSIIALDPPDHTRIRRLANKAFLPSVIRGMMPKIQARIDELLDEVEAKGDEFDFVSDFAAYVPVSVTAEILGVDPHLARGDFKRWTIDLLKSPSRTVLPEDELASMRRSAKELRDYFIDQIEDRRRKPGDDLVSVLVRAQEGDETLTDLEVLSLIVLIQFGGAETPSHLISTTLYELFENPDQREAVRANPSLAEQAVDETLRHMSTVHFVFQTATQDVQVQGETIPGNSMVFSFIGSANRDPRAFDDPDRYDLNRKSANPHLGFAAGPHYCIGAALGKTMCAMALNSTLKRMPNLHRVDPETEWLPSFWVRGLKQFMVAP